MIIAAIILAVIAVMLGGYILYDILYSKKQKAAAAVELEVPAVGEKEPEAVATDFVVKKVEKYVEFNPEELHESVTAQEVDTLMEDEVAESLIEKSEVKTDKTKQGIINIDTLSEHFRSGEIVTLDEIRKRIKGFGKTTYIKVLARGTLDKTLTVEADSFSIQAVKMIVLTGGKVIKKSE